MENGESPVELSGARREPNALPKNECSTLREGSQAQPLRSALAPE
jgi:hypothetical protein